MSTVEKDVLSRTDLEGLVDDRDQQIAELKARLAEWEESYDGIARRDVLFSTVSGREVKPLYTELDHGQDEEPDPEFRRFIYDTTLLGYSNGGHTYGDVLTDDERSDLIEYLKTL